MESHRKIGRQPEGQIEGQKDVRQTHKQREVQIGREADTQIGRQVDRQLDRQTGKMKYRNNKIRSERVR